MLHIQYDGACGRIFAGILLMNDKVTANAVIGGLLILGAVVYLNLDKDLPFKKGKNSLLNDTVFFCEQMKKTPADFFRRGCCYDWLIFVFLPILFSPDFQFLCFLDKLVPEVRMGDGYQCFRTLPG
jgi:hypothetical protein